MKERIAACFALLIKRAAPTGGFQGGSRNNADKDRTSYSGKMLTPGLISEMNAGDDAVTINPGNGSSEATGFLKLLQRLVGAGQGLSYESTSRDKMCIRDSGNTNKTGNRIYMVVKEWAEQKKSRSG